MEFHEHLHSIGTKEGLKERKLQKAVESFTWNITILKVFSTLFLMLVILQPVSIPLPAWTSSAPRGCSVITGVQWEPYFLENPQAQ